MEIKNSTFIVTGGASGLGAATVRTLVAAGGKVVVADVNADAGNALAKELGQARFIKTDVTSEADGKAAVALALSEFGGLQGLFGGLGRFHDRAHRAGGAGGGRGTGGKSRRRFDGGRPGFDRALRAAGEGQQDDQGGEESRHDSAKVSFLH